MSKNRNNQRQFSACHHVGVFVKSLARMNRFYTRELGFRLEREYISERKNMKKIFEGSGSPSTSAQDASKDAERKSKHFRPRNPERSPEATPRGGVEGSLAKDPSTRPSGSLPGPPVAKARAGRVSPLEKNSPRAQIFNIDSSCRIQYLVLRKFRLELFYFLDVPLVKRDSRISGLNHWTVVVADKEAFCRRLKEKKIKTIEIPKINGVTYFFQDPEQNLVEVKNYDE